MDAEARVSTRAFARATNPAPRDSRRCPGVSQKPSAIPAPPGYRAASAERFSPIVALLHARLHGEAGVDGAVAPQSSRGDGRENAATAPVLRRSTTGSAHAEMRTQFAAPEPQAQCVLALW